jgi:transketolase
LIAFYDDNGISIDSEKADMRKWFTDDTPRRFDAYGWHVLSNVDGHDPAAIDAALESAKAETNRPSLICCKTVIAKGAPKKANTGAAHGAPLGPDEVAATRANIGWKYPPFEVPEHVYAGWDARERGARLQAEWNQKFAAFARAHPELAHELKRRMNGALPAGWPAARDQGISKVNEKAETISTRKASQNALETFGSAVPDLVGGSADLAGSNLTIWSGSKPIEHGTGGNYIYFGVREFAMAAMTNGIALHGGLIPYCATFLTFSDYARNALRMAALMKCGSIFVFTHDSIGLGEDGPTHQPIEHAATLRLIPNMDVWRPCDAVETACAWAAAIERRDGPTSLLLTRQNVPFQKRSAQAFAAIARGGYVLAEATGGTPRCVIIATGSEVSLALEAQKALAADGVPVRVVSMPSTNVFDRQDAPYRNQVLPRGVPRVAVEAGVTDYWRKYVGTEGRVIGIDRFGESAPAADLFKFFGFTAEHIVSAVKEVL